MVCRFHGTFSCYAVVGMVILLHASLMMPETKGKSLASLEQMFDVANSNNKEGVVDKEGYGRQPEQEGRKQWDCNGGDGKFSFANAVLNERDCYVIPHEGNVPKRRKSSRVLQPPTLTTVNEGEGKEMRVQIVS